MKNFINPKFLSYICTRNQLINKSRGIRIAVRRETRLCKGQRLQIYGFSPDYSTKMLYN